MARSIGEISTPPAAAGPRGGRDLGVLWAGVAILLPALLVSIPPVSTIDLAYGLRAGSMFLDGAGIQRVDTFTFTAAGLPWLNQQWLGQVLFAAAYRAGGWPALATFWAVIVVAIQALLWRAARTMGAEARWAGVAVLLGFVVAAQGIGLRAQVLGLLCLAALLAVVADRGDHPGRLWLAVPILAVWANIHGSFPIGLVLLGLAAAQDVAARRRARPASAVLVAASLATLANPFGVDAWRYVTAIGTDPTIARFVVEWRHTSPFDPAGAVFYGSVAAVLVLVAVRIGQPDRPPLTMIVWLAGLALLGAWAVRAVAWWGVGAAPAVAVLLTAVAAMRTGGAPDATVPAPRLAARDGLRRAQMALVVAFGLAVVAVQPIWHPSPDGSGIGSRLRDAPEGIARAVEDAAAARPAARVFNAQRWGSWLELATPEASVFADSRIELIPADAWRDYILVSEGDARWREILDAWGVDVIVAALADQPALAALVRSGAGWHVTYEDADGLVAERFTPSGQRGSSFPRSGRPRSGATRRSSFPPSLGRLPRRTSAAATLAMPIAGSAVAAALVRCRRVADPTAPTHRTLRHGFPGRPAGAAPRASRIDSPAMTVASLTIVLPAFNGEARLGPAVDEPFGYLRRHGEQGRDGAPGAARL